MTIKDSLIAEIRREKDLESIKKALVIITEILYEAPYMEPHVENKTQQANSSYEEALAVQTMAAVNFLLILGSESKNKKAWSEVVGGMALRSLIEVLANMHYFAIHKNDQKLAKKYLHTANITADISSNLKKKNIKRYYWTDKSISERVEVLSRKSQIQYNLVYYYLSSYVHGDAGYLHSFNPARSNVFIYRYMLMALICMFDMMDALEDAGMLESPYVAFANEIHEYLRKKKK